jgi:S-adenosylmethionine synthetase
MANGWCRRSRDGEGPGGDARLYVDPPIVIGWAGYDAKVRYLPPEHFLVLEFRDVLWESRCGPDGKLIVRLREDDDGFALEHVLVTLEHPESLTVLTLAERVDAVLSRHYDSLRAADRRWAARWRDVELLVNPNGPLSDAGSRKDNGQTGRKLVMDYYGPRVPIGGGAIYGKHPTHVDRFGARVARELAVDAVKRGAGECLIRAVYAPNVAEPLDVQVDVNRGSGEVMVRTERLVLRGRRRAYLSRAVGSGAAGLEVTPSRQMSFYADLDGSG